MSNIFDKREVIYVKKTSKEIEEKVCQDYLTNQYSSRELGVKYSLSKSTILRILERNGIKAENHRLVNNDLIIDYFKIIDSEEKAYFLGFIFADGCVSNNQLFIDINDKDREVLERFRQEVHSNCIISTRIKGKSIMSRITIKNKSFVEHLKRYGIVENKTNNTYHLPVELVPKNFYKDFIRGLIDGDGWIIKTQENYYKIGYVTHYSSVAEDFVYMINYLLIDKWNNKIIRRNNKYSTVQIQSKKQVEQLAHALYANNNICLSRKYQVAQEIYDSKC